MYALAFVVMVALAIPPAAKVLAIAVTVYGCLQGLKQAPWFKTVVSGWVAVAFNVVLATIAVVTTTPADQLYTGATLVAIVTAASAASGVHGTVTLLRQQSQQKAAARAAAQTPIQKFPPPAK